MHRQDKRSQRRGLLHIYLGPRRTSSTTNAKIRIDEPATTAHPIHALRPACELDVTINTPDAKTSARVTDLAIINF